ncbi:serine/threonine-protein kinase [Pseudomaricurvus sp. HS19]|uniref:serine/threonine-protein kinase n=1 Tax=Pseudomaricurvus sp. HS19 TaxID=2692626 RepID=UPI001370180B|nr:serine/threonine-protein kinase [Pseudomaricurvus sp. HS19]MYM64779.1 protein kinase [Pseudomaricurvus sp. HS19]
MTDRETHNLALPIGSSISQYRIESVLGMGGFGIVYKARHQFLYDRVVAIKEFLPRDLAGRRGTTVVPHSTSDQDLYNNSLQRFRNEGRTLSALSHPNVVYCQDLFDANDTAYLIMHFEDGAPLDELIRKHEAQGTRYTEQQLLAILIPVAKGLEYVHAQGVLHRDIKPDNIFLRRADESPVIIDFGAARQNYLSATRTQSPFTPFYAPIEQMDANAKPLPTLDIHAFGGLMYRMVCGAAGPDAQKRLMDFSFGQKDPLEPAQVRMAGVYSDDFLAMIDQCLALKAGQRPQTMTEVREKLEQLAANKAEQYSAPDSQQTNSVPQGSEATAPSSAGSKSTIRKLATLVIFGIFVAAPLTVWLKVSNSPQPAPPQITAPPTPPAAVKTIPLYVTTQPEQAVARIQLLNYGTDFYQGIELPPGTYQLKLSADGYKDRLKTITIDDFRTKYELDVYMPPDLGCDGNCTNGYGTWKYTNGKYSGLWQNSERHGKGKYFWKDGSSYSGEWQGNKRHGEGDFIAANGRTERQYWWYGKQVNLEELFKLELDVTIDEILAEEEQKIQ